MTYKDFAFKSDLSPAGPADDLALDLNSQTRLQVDSVGPKGILRSFLPDFEGGGLAAAVSVLSKLTISTMKTKNIASPAGASSSGQRVLSIAFS